MFNGLQTEVETRRALNATGLEVPLTAAEFDLLLGFLRRPGRVLSRESIVDLTGQDAATLDRSIDVLVGCRTASVVRRRGESTVA